MNELIEHLAEKATKEMDQEAFSEDMNIPPEWYEKFAELIVKECIEIAKAELVPDTEIDQSKDIEDRCYLRGNNGGVVDAVVAIRNHFRSENEVI
jgi:hypothetical protein